MASDGSALLALVRGPEFTGYPAWSIPLPAGEPRRLGNAEVLGADFFPDGRVLMVIERGLFVADKDGSNPRKLFAASGSVGASSVSPDGEQIVFTMIDARTYLINTYHTK
jgi:WD40-like Beta Propeller Repeat